MRRAPARGNVLAKTGTTNLASALSGFAGGRYAFSVVQNGRPIYAYWARDRPGPLRDRARRAARRLGPSSSARSCSVRIGTPFFWAFVSFEAPGSSPTTRPVVFFETESVTLAPFASSAAFASSRVQRSSVPGDDVGRAGQRPLDRPVLLVDLEPQAERRAAPGRARGSARRRTTRRRSPRGRARSPRPPRPPPASRP